MLLTLIEKLPADSVLRQLGREALDSVLSHAVRRPFERGGLLYRQGDDGDSMAVVLHGLFKVYVVNARGREVVLSFISPGGVAGEISLLDSGKRTASVEASEPSEVLILQSRDVRSVLERDAAASYRVVRALCQRLRQTNSLVEDGAATALEPRLARAVLRVIRDAGGAAANGTLRVRQSDLASYAGVSRENVNRQLQKWVDEGVLVLSRGRMDVRDMQRLTEFAEDLE